MQAGQDDLVHEELPPYLTNLGLLSEPFAEAPSGHFYYVGADGEQRLDLMHHLAPYSPLLVILGEHGVGKTALLHQFAARAKDNWRIIVVTARPDMDRDDFLASMGESLGLSLQSQVDPQAQYLALIAQLRALRQTAQVPILLVDDAQVLSTSLFELIHKLCAENDDGHLLSVMLFGTPQLQVLWNQQALMPLAARVTHTFEINPYSEEETARYIRHRLRAAGASDDGPFDSMTINKIHAASGGVPARINTWAHGVLVDRTMTNKQSPVKENHGGTSGGNRGRRALTVAGVIVVVVLVAGPLRSVWFKSSPPTPPQRAQSLPLPPSAPAKTDDSGVKRVVRSGDVAVPSAPSTASPSAQQEQSGSGSEVVKTIPLPAEDTTVVEEPALAKTPEPAPPPTASTLPAAPTPPVSVVESKAVAEPTKIVSKNKEVSPITPVKPSSQEQDWLKAQPADNYTLQLMASKDEEAARRFLEKRHLQGKAAYYPVVRNGQTLYAIVYGSFPARGDAVQAAKELPKTWGIRNPWIRSFKSLPVRTP
jgi:DamX protein